MAKKTQTDDGKRSAKKVKLDWNLCLILNNSKKLKILHDK